MHTVHTVTHSMVADRGSQFPSQMTNLADFGFEDSHFVPVGSNFPYGIRQVVNASLFPGRFLTSVDIQDVYLHIPVFLLTVLSAFSWGD